VRLLLPGNVAPGAGRDEWHGGAFIDRCRCWFLFVFVPIEGGGSRGDSGATNSDLLLKESVQLPRKLVRGQDVWLGKGAEQTRQILKVSISRMTVENLGRNSRRSRQF